MADDQNAAAILPEPRVKHNGKQIRFSLIFYYILLVVLILSAWMYYEEVVAGFRLLLKVDLVWIIIALLVQLTTFYVSAIIYRLLLRLIAPGKIPSINELYQVSVISLFINQTVPSAGISGNTFLFSFLQKKNFPLQDIVMVILAELLIFYLSVEAYIIFFLLAGLIWINMSLTFTSVLLSGLVVFLVFGTFIALIGQKFSFAILMKKMQKYHVLVRLFSGLVKKAGKQTFTVSTVWKLMNGNRKVVIIVFLLQAVLILLDAFTLLALATGVGMQISFFLLLLVLVSTKIISVIPFSPGSLILFEGSMTYFFSIIGIPVATALTVTLLFRIFTFWLPIPAGLILYRMWIRRNARDGTLGGEFPVLNNEKGKELV